MDCNIHEIDDEKALVKRHLQDDSNEFSMAGSKISTFSDAGAVEVNGECEGKDQTTVASGKDGAGYSRSVEELFRNKEVPPWQEQITMRAIVLSFLVGTVFSIIMMKLNLTTGVPATMNISAGLLGFVGMRSWSKVLDKSGFLQVPFTRQENVVIQTCVVACYSTAYGGGFGAYLLAMSTKIYKQSGTSTAGNTPNTVKDPSIGWMVGFLFLVTFGGIFVLVPLRKVLILDSKLTYPSGTATAVLINSFHSPKGNKTARKQIRCFAKYFTFSLLWACFQWFFTGGLNCGFAKFPTFGLKAFHNSFYFDFSMTYVGAGMICPHIVNVSLLIGAVVSWGLLWPLIETQKGDWFPKNISESDMNSLNGYRISVCIALILGDGLYNFVKIMYIMLKNMYLERRQRMHTIPLTAKIDTEKLPEDILTYDEKRRNQIFMKDSIPMWIAASGYTFIAAISSVVLPHIFPNTVTWYYVLTGYVVAPFLAFCNAYGTGVTDQNMANNYSKFLLFVFAAWAGKAHGGVLVGLVACGVIKGILASASDLMHDFKTGYLTLSSPRSMFVSQLIGTAMGCVVAPLTFWLFWMNTTFDVGNPTGEYKAPFAIIDRNMAILGVEGFSALPKHCLQFFFAAFALAILINAFKDLVPKRVSPYVPLPMAMAIPFIVGAYFTIDMFVGTTIVFIWQKLNRRRADIFVPAVASGLMCGEGIWILPASVLAIMKINPPICMQFLRRQ